MTFIGVSRTGKIGVIRTGNETVSLDIPDCKFERRKIFNDCEFFKIFVEHFYFFFWRSDIERYFCRWFLLLPGINGPLFPTWPVSPKHGQFKTKIEEVLQNCTKVRRSADWKSLVLKTDKEFSTSWFLGFDEVYLMIPSRGSNCVTVSRKWR